MSTGTGIEWTDATWNPVAGCAPVSAGCANCYAKGQTHRLEAMGQAKYAGLTVLQPSGVRHFNGVVRCCEEALEIPLGWRKPRRIFVNSMSDLFYGTERDRAYHAKHAPKGVPFAPVPFEFVDRVFAVMALTPQHTYQVLTKRPERMAEYLDGEAAAAGMGHRIAQAARELVGRSEMVGPGWGEIAGRVEHARDYFDDHDGILPNVWLGTSCENQAAADERIPHLLRCPAALRFLSCEPLLGPIDLRPCFDPTGASCCGGDETCYGNGRCPITQWPRDEHGQLVRPDWVIVGGESGGGARPCDVGWVRSIVAQCRAAGVPAFVKQDSGPHSGLQGQMPDDLWSNKEFPNAS